MRGCHPKIPAAPRGLASPGAASAAGAAPRAASRWSACATAAARSARPAARPPAAPASRDRPAAAAAGRRNAPIAYCTNTGPGGMSGARRSGARPVGVPAGGAAPARRGGERAGPKPRVQRGETPQRAREIPPQRQRSVPSAHSVSRDTPPNAWRRSMPWPNPRFIHSMRRAKRGISSVGGEGAAADMQRVYRQLEQMASAIATAPVNARCHCERSAAIHRTRTRAAARRWARWIAALRSQ